MLSWISVHEILNMKKLIKNMFKHFANILLNITSKLISDTFYCHFFNIL